MTVHTQPPITVAERLVRIETKIDALLHSGADQETRIRKLEGRVTALFGGGSFLAACVAVLASFGDVFRA